MSIHAPNTEGFGQPDHAVSPDPDESICISAILNEARHVFEWHADGHWQSEYKDGYAKLLQPYLQGHPSLIKRIVDLNDRVFSMVVYRAVELLDGQPKI